MADNRPILAYFGHHKCGSKMVMSVVERAVHYMGLKYGSFHSPKMWGYSASRKTLDKVVEEQGLDFVSYNNADKIFMGEDSRFLGIHVIRDPRDIIVSSYFSHLHSHSTDQWPELVEHRKTLQSLPINEGLLESLKFTANLKIDGWEINLFDALMNWNYSLPNVLELKFESLVNNPYQAFLDMFSFLCILEHQEKIDRHFLRSVVRYQMNARFGGRSILGKAVRIPAWMILFFVYTNRFEKLAGGRARGSEDVKSHYRKGIPGDWRRYFTDQHKLIFKTQYNDLLVKLGYEIDDKW